MRLDKLERKANLALQIANSLAIEGLEELALRRMHKSGYTHFFNGNGLYYFVDENLKQYQDDDAAITAWINTWQIFRLDLHYIHLTREDLK